MTRHFRAAMAIISVSLFLASAVAVTAAETEIDAYISTGDNHWLGSSLPVDSPRSIADTFEFLQKVCGVKRVYWRGLEEATWVRSMDERPENCRYYSFWQWIRRLYREVDPDLVAARVARERGMEFWGVATMFDWGGEADTPGFGDYPMNSESKLRLQHPEWAPLDRHGFRRQGGPIEYGYPEAREALINLHAGEMRRVGYAGLVFLTYAENYSIRFQDEFGFSPPVVDAFKSRVGTDPTKEPFSRVAGREDWLRVRGGFITEFLRGLKAELAKDKRSLGLFVDPHDIRLPQPWNVPETMRTAGAHHLDLETWVREGIVDLLPVYGYCAPRLQDAALADVSWLVRGTGARVSVVTSSPRAEKWAKLRAEGVGTIMALNEDFHFVERGALQEQTVEALGSGDLARVCKALSQVIGGKLTVPVDALAPLAREGNLVQRRLALQALALTKSVEALPLIEAALADPENGIRCMAAQVLKGFHRTESLKAMFAALERFGNHPLREGVANTLMGMRPFPREAIQQTIAHTKSEDVLIPALRALSAHATDEDVPGLLQGLAAPFRYPRFLATTGLGNARKSDEAARALLRVLTHHDAVVANRAATSLAEMAKRNEPALAPHRADALEKLTQRFSRYTAGYTGIDHDWGYRTVGNALLDFGAAGRAVLEKAVAGRSDLHHARLAFRVLHLPQRPNSFSEVTEAENAAAFKHLPPPPPGHQTTTLIVDPAGEIKTIAAAISLARAGDTIRLTPGVYKESIVFHDRSGQHGKPITVDCQGAILDGGDDQDLATWERVGEDLYRKVKLLRLEDHILWRWFMLFDGKIQRMGRWSKAASVPLKQPSELQLNEWTYLAEEEALYVRVKPGTRVTAPIRANGVAISGTCRHLVIKNVTATHVHNDGFNIHGWCRYVAFENIKAIECGDDGVSAHDDCEIAVNGLVSEGNATGITDTGVSVSDYRNVVIRDCGAYDLYFIGSNAHSVTDATIHSRAARAVMLDGMHDNRALCTLVLSNVKLLREAGKPDEIRVTANSRLELGNVECVNLKLQCTGGEVIANDSSFSGEAKPDIHLWPGSKWVGDDNTFRIAGLRYGNQWFYAKDRDAFSAVFGSDTRSRWE